MPAFHIGLMRSLTDGGTGRPRPAMQEEGWVGECRVSTVTLFMSFTPIGVSLLFVSASEHDLTGTGRFPQLRDAIG